MDVKNCKKCGRLYNHLVGPNYCPRCMNDMEEKFQEVKKYIYEHPGAGVTEVSEQMDVSPGQIRQWVREERLQFAEGSVTDITCENCGVNIFSGRFCTKCKGEMVRNLNSAYHVPLNQKKDDENRNARMRYLR